MKGTVNFGLKYLKNESYEVVRYSDSDWAGLVDDSKNTSGYCYSFASVVFSWNSKKQEIVAQSSTEAEYIATAVAANQAQWLRKVLSDLRMVLTKGILLNIDNQSAIAITKNSMHHGKTKHIQVKLLALRDAVKKNEVDLKYGSTEDQLADIFTKGLSCERFEILRSGLGVCKAKD